MKKLIFLFLILSTKVFSQNIVETGNGKIEGYTNKNIHIFKGVPFAQPPLGELRWKAPQPIKPWQGTVYKYRKDFLMDWAERWRWLR